MRALSLSLFGAILTCYQLIEVLNIMLYKVITFRMRDQPLNIAGNPAPPREVLDEIAEWDVENNGGVLAFSGVTDEEPHIGVMFIEVITHDPTKASMKVAGWSYARLTDERPTVYYVSLEDLFKTATDALSSPVSELVFVYFPISMPAEARQRIRTAGSTMRPITERHGALAIADGWAGGNVELRKDVLERLGSPSGIDTGKAQVWVITTGWQTKEAHFQLQASQDYKDNIHNIVDHPEIRGVDVFHVCFDKMDLS